MKPIQATLAEVLTQLQRPGDFFATGTLDIHPPRLAVDGVGPIALPLLPFQADQLVAVAEQAPYGRGSETLVDTEVRRTWQIDAARVQLDGRRWAEDLAEIVTRVGAGLGVDGRIKADLYKLLIYDTGSFFVSHRDTEKAPGMFATLVLVLPSAFSGGELIVRHKDREARLDLRRSEPSEVAFAAFYADCRHEVLPIASGCRLALVYNLIRPDGEPLPAPPDLDTPVQQAAALLRDWGAQAADAPVPNKLVYPLEHAYTEAELGFDALKGADKAAAGILVAAAAAADCELYLSLLSVSESGWAEYAGGGYWGRGDVEYEIGEVTDSSWDLHDLRPVGGGGPPIQRLTFNDTELAPPDALAGIEDEEPDFEEATGNAGVSFERFYQCAALVLWPRSRRAGVVTDQGLETSVPFLSRLVDEWEASGAEPGDARWQEANALASSIRQHWPINPHYHRRASGSSESAALLDALVRLGDQASTTAFLAGPITDGSYSTRDNAAIARALTTLDREPATNLLTAIIANNAPCRPTACAELLHLCASQADDAAERTRAAALALLAALPTEAGQAPDFRCEQPKPELVVASLSTLSRIHPALADQAASLFLDHPAIYPMETILRPAALRLAEQTRPGSDAVDRLRTAVLTELERRIAEPLEPPADWTRPAEVACRCNHCRDLNRFLAAPAEAEWRLKAVQQTRDHIEHQIERHRCDLDLITDRHGRPYTLVCTKNRGSYERRVKARERDIADRDSLLGAVT